MCCKYYSDTSCFKNLRLILGTCDMLDGAHLNNSLFQKAPS